MFRYFLVVLLVPIVCFSEKFFSFFDDYQEKITRDEIEEKLYRFLRKDPAISQYFSLNDEVFTLYDHPEGQKDRQIEYILKLARQSKEKNIQEKRKKNLVGIKIAIDPGHFGGKYAHLEDRYIDIPPSFERTGEVRFDEGTLSFLTAMYLKTLLEKEGAIVLLTRDKIEEGAYNEDFFDWLKSNPQFWSGEISLSQLFRKHYNLLDLHARAQKINVFQPDLTIVIHYNSHHTEFFSSNSHVTSSNYNLAFVPGSFFRNELLEKENRFEFLRLLITNDLYLSKELSQSIVKQFTKHLNIPIVTQGDGASYLENACMRVDDGVYARNLALTRLVHGPVCYGETLIQNNIDECLNLSRTDFFIDGKACSSRIKQVAEAYFEGIKEYLENR